MSTATQTTLAALQNPVPREAAMPAVRASFFDLQGFELLQRVSKAFASSTLVPQAYQGNMANCMIALNLAERLHADALMVMQNLYIVHGNPGWSSKFLIASVNTCGRFSAMRHEWRGNAGDGNYGCRAWTIEKATGERLDGAWVDWNMVRAEGWDKKNGSKWKTMPDQMFIYRAAAFWQRAYAPEISMGLSTSEELHDVVEFNDDGSYNVSVQELRASQMKDVPQEEPVAQSVQEAQEQPVPTVKAEAQANTLTYAVVAERINKAEDIDLLDVAADFIRQVADQEQQAELTAMYKQRREALTNPAPTRAKASPINAE